MTKIPCLAFIIVLIDIISHKSLCFSIKSPRHIFLILEESSLFPMIVVLQICYILSMKLTYFYLKWLDYVAYSGNSQCSNKTVTSTIKWLYDVTFILNVIFIYCVGFSEIITHCNSIHFCPLQGSGQGVRGIILGYFLTCSNKNKLFVIDLVIDYDTVVLESSPPGGMAALPPGDVCCVFLPYLPNGGRRPFS